VLAGWLILGETLVMIQIIGCVMIFAAVILSQFREWTSGTIDRDHLVEGR
jgi:drug/metabolite transporter (DMT)-like permease